MVTVFPKQSLRNSIARLNFIVRLTSIFTICLSVSICYADQQRVRVTANKVNLRAAPKYESETVGQVSHGDILILQGDISEPWVKVTPPDSVDLWVYSSLVTDKKINVSKAMVRAGAGLNYNTVGSLERNDPVVVRGTLGDWTKIAPFPSSSVWITNAYVELVAHTKHVAPVAPAVPVAPVSNISLAISPPPNDHPIAPEPLVDKVRPETVSISTQPPKQSENESTTAKTISEEKSKRSLISSSDSKKVIGPAQIPNSRLNQDKVQALSGSYSGTLASSGTGSHPSKYRLVTFSGNEKPQTVCYVLGNSKQLESFKGEFIVLEGAVYWYNGTKIPAIYAQNILRERIR